MSKRAGPNIPTKHKTTHEDGGTDEINIGNLSGELGDPQKTKVDSGTTNPTVDNYIGRLFFNTADDILYRWNGTTWDEVGVMDYADLDGIPSDFNPSPHKTTHEDGGDDEIDVTGLSGELADAQIPKTHATTHEVGGSDVIKQRKRETFVVSLDANDQPDYNNLQDAINNLPTTGGSIILMNGGTSKTGTHYTMTGYTIPTTFKYFSIKGVNKPWMRITTGNANNGGITVVGGYDQDVEIKDVGFKLQMPDSGTISSLILIGTAYNVPVYGHTLVDNCHFYSVDVHNISPFGTNFANDYKERGTDLTNNYYETSNTLDGCRKTFLIIGDGSYINFSNNSIESSSDPSSPEYYNTIIHLSTGKANYCKFIGNYGYGKFSNFIRSTGTTSVFQKCVIADNLIYSEYSWAAAYVGIFFCAEGIVNGMQMTDNSYYSLVATFGSSSVISIYQYYEFQMIGNSFITNGCQNPTTDNFYWCDIPNALINGFGIMQGNIFMMLNAGRYYFNADDTIVTGNWFHGTLVSFTVGGNGIDANNKKV